ncbi:MAG TPA: hypothetical protein DHW15_10640 [Bacteroidetes bacterium]|jgi:hypothetical protein|nr:hypothetical protein [Bacteroidota bacterium]
MQMIKYISAFILLIVSLTALSQPELTYQKVIGGTSNDIATEILQISDNQYVVSGYSRSSDIDLAVNNGLFDLLTFSTDSLGNILWRTTLGGSLDDAATSMLATADGYLLCGFSKSSDGDVLANYGDNDGWLVQLNTDGAAVWQSNLGGSGSDIINDIVAIPSGGYMVVGSTTSTDIDLDGNYGGQDVWVMRIGGGGAVVWSKHFGGSGDDVGRSIIYTNEQYIITGYTFSNDFDVSGNHDATGLTEDVWVLNLDIDGNINWQYCAGGSSGDEGEDLVAINDTLIAVVAESRSLDGDLSGHYGGSTTRDIWVFFMHSDGNFITGHHFGGTDDEVPGSIRLEDSTRLIITGSSESNDIDVSAHFGAVGVSDIWIFQTDTSLTLQWENNFGGTGMEFCSGIVALGDTNYIAIGQTRSTDNQVLLHHGFTLNNDIWFMRLGSFPTPCAPAFTSPLSDVLTCFEDTVSLTAITEPAAQVYEWHFPDGGSVFSNYSNSLVLAPVPAGLDSTYFIVAKSLCGFDTSTIAAFRTDEVIAPSIFPLLSPSLCDSGEVLLHFTPEAGFTYAWYFNGEPIPDASGSSYLATISGDYSVLATRSENCVNFSAPRTVTYETDDAIISFSGPANLCASESVTLSTTLDEDWSYQWFYNGDTLVGAVGAELIVTETGNYSVRITISDSCFSNSITVAVINETPVASIMANGDTDICLTGSVLLNTSVTGIGYSYQWLQNDIPITGATTIGLVTLDTGYFALEISNTFGCSDTSEAIYVFTSCPEDTTTPVGLSPDLESIAMLLYPNPAATTLNMEVTIPGAINLPVRILDLQGREVYLEWMVFNPATTRYQVPVEVLSPGMYILQIPGSSPAPFVKE